MHLDPHVRALADQLTAAAALGDDRTQQIARTLATALDPATRLALVGAVSAAADEITAALLAAPGAPRVSTRLDGDEVRFDLVGSDPAPTTAETVADDGEATARISLRLTERLKTQIDEAAGRDGVSVNTWLVRAATRGLGGGRASGGGWGWPGGFPGGPWTAAWGGDTSSGGAATSPGRVTGWVDG